jgi:hypothetical protein
MKIIINESQYNELNKKINEQSFGGSSGIVGTPQNTNTSYFGVKKSSNPYPCVPTNVVPFIEYVKFNGKNICKKLNIDYGMLLLFTKASIGIMERETNYSSSITSMAEQLMDLFDDKFLFHMLKKKGYIGSVGPAQFRYKTWNDLDMKKIFGMGRDDMRTITGAGLGTIALLAKDYKRALSMGYSDNTKSENPFLEKKGIKIPSTNNAALDISIVSHNMDVIRKWCYTNNPNIAGPCEESVYEPYDKNSVNYKKYGTLKVFQNKQVRNYLPNKKHEKLTSLGYLTEVVKVMNTLGCVKFN